MTNPADRMLERMFLGRMARLASLKLQERFITHATAKEYYAVALLLDEARDVVANLLSIQSFSERVGEPGRVALLAFDSVLRQEIARVNLSAGDLVHADPAWVRIREAALNGIAATGFDLGEFEAREMAEAT